MSRGGAPSQHSLPSSNQITYLFLRPISVAAGVGASSRDIYTGCGECQLAFAYAKYEYALCANAFVIFKAFWNLVTRGVLFPTANLVRMILFSDFPRDNVTMIWNLW